MSSVIPGFRAVIPAGGAGTRLWPLSRQARPKFLLDMTGSGRTLIQSTWDRLMPLAGPDGIVVVTGQAHQQSIQDQLPVGPEILIEPSPRNSMAAIGLAAAVLQQREGDVIIGSFAADHVITDRRLFDEAIRAGIEAARDGYVCTIGIKPDGPATGFGYIHFGELIQGGPAKHVLAFKEKPDAALAKEYLATGQYRWNAGMFITRTSVLLDRLAEYRPTLHDGLTTIAAAWGTPQQAQVMSEQWDGLERIAIDHAIAEPLAAAGGVAMVPGDFGWDDIGDWSSITKFIEAGPDAVLRLGQAGAVMAVEANNLTVASTTGRPVAVVGLDKVVVVDTEDVILITSQAQAQRVGEIPAALAASGQKNLL